MPGETPDTSGIPHGIWEGHEKLGSELSRPHGFQRIAAEQRSLDLDYLPEHPADDGVYVYLALVYPLIDLKVSLWEYYHSQSDIDLRPKTYITDEPPVELHGTRFHLSKEAHRLHWQPDADAVKLFLEFVRTVIFKQDTRQRVWALTVYDVEIPYPKTGSKDRIRVKVVLPYSPVGAFVPASRKYELTATRRLRVIWNDASIVTDFINWRNQQTQRRFDKQKHGVRYVGPEPLEPEEHPYYKAEELEATAQTLWGV